jgi:hypothetical protein
MVSQLLYHLPPTEQYRIIFMERNLDEVLVSQEKMLERRNAPAAPRERMKEAFTLHLEKLFRWLDEQQNVTVLVINYNQLLDDSRRHAEKISQFLHGTLTADAMVQTVDPVLYRNRNTMAQV